MELLILAASALIVAAYICRLTMLKIGHNKSWVIVMHMALAMSTGWVGYHAYLGDLNFGDIAALVGAAAWIVVSLPTWKSGVPPHFMTHPVSIDPIELNSIPGGKQ